MSQTVDNRVVELQFDNQQFEQGTKESLNTIQKLKEALKFKDAGENLKDLGNVTKNFDLNGIGNAVEQVGEKFSTMRLVGLMALSNIVDGAMQAGKKILQAFTAPLNQIRTGGWNRAMNIEDAKFQLKGLGVAWEEVADDIDYAVSGTAYGLDSAAKAASQLTASGVKSGEAMKAALRGISGVAAMANTSYEEISPIFTTVAGQGKLMTMQLRQLESRGLNAAATLGKALGKSEQEIRDMVTKGKIDFDTFAKAMDDAFGEHAKDANNTFTGALSNIKAALSRIGQNFATPIIQNAIPVFNKLRLIVNAINAGMKDSGLYTAFEKVATVVSKVLVANLTKIQNFFEVSNKFVPNIVDALKIGFTNVLRIFLSIKNAWDKVFTGSASKNLINITAMFKRLMEVLTPSEKALKGLEKVFTAVFTILKKLGTAIGSVVKTIGPPLINIFMKIVNVGLILVGAIADIITAILNMVSASQLLQGVFGAITLVISKVVDIFKTFKDRLSDSSSGIGSFANKLSTGFRTVAAIISGILATAINVVITLFNKLRSIDFSNFLNGLNNIKNFVIDLLNYVKQIPVVAEFINITITAFEMLIGVIVKTGEAFAKLVAGIYTGKITFNDVAESVRNFALKIKDAIREFLQTNQAIQKLKSGFGDFKNKFGEIAKTILDRLRDISAARVLLVAFGGAMTMLVFKIGNVMSNLSKLFGTGTKALETFIESISPKKTPFFSTFTGNLLKIAVAIGLVAASIKTLTEIPVDRLKEVVKQLGIMVGLVSGFALLMTVLNKFSTGKKGALTAFSTNVLMLSGAIGILSISLALLQKIDIKSAAIAVGAILVIMTGLSTAAVLISKFAPKLATGSVFLIAFAASMAIIIASLKKLNELDLSGIKGNWAEIGAIFLGIAAVAFAVGKIGIGPVLGLLAFVGAFSLIMGKIDDIGTYILEASSKFATSLKQAVSNVVKAVTDTISTITDAIFNPITNFITKARMTMMSIFAAVGKFEAVKKVSKIFGGILAFLEGMKGFIKGAVVIGTGIGVLIVLKSFFELLRSVAIIGEGLKNIAKSFLMIAAGIAILAYLCKVISKWVDESPNMGAAMLIVVGLGGLIGALMALSEKANPDAIMQVRKTFTSLAALFVGMGVFLAIAGGLKPDEWLRATASLTGALTVLGIFGYAIATVNARSGSASSKAGLLHFIGIIALFGTLIGALAVLMMQLRDVDDYKTLGIALAAIGTLVVLIDSVLERLANIRVGTGWAPILALFGGLAILAIGIGGAVKIIITNLKEGEMARAWSALGLLMAGLAVIAGVALGIEALMKNKAFNATKTSIANLKQFQNVILLLVGVMGALTLITVVLENVDGGKIIGHLEALTLVVFELAGIAVLMSLFAKNGSQKGMQSAIIAIGVMSLCFLAIGKVAADLENVDGGKIIGHLQAITLVIGELAGIAILMSLFAKDIYGVAAGVTAIGIMTLCFIGISQMAIQLEQIPGGKIVGHLQAISLVLLELAVIVGLMGVFAEWITLGLIGVAALVSMTALFMQIGSMAVVLKDIKGDEILGHLSAISLVILELGAILALLGVLSPLCALGLIAVDGITDIVNSMLTMSVVLKMLEGMTAEGIRDTMEELAQGIAKIVAVGAIAGTVSTGIVILGSSLLQMGQACIEAGVGLTLFAQAMLVLQTLKNELPGISSALETFFGTLNSGMATQFAQISATVSTSISILTRSVIIGLQSGLATAATVAYQGASAIGLNIVNGFNAGTGMTSGNGGFLNKFATDFRTSMSSMSTQLQTTTKKAWFDVGKQTEMGFRDGAQWHSPPVWQNSFFNDVGVGFNTGALNLGAMVGPLFQKIGLNATDGITSGLKEMLPNTQSIMGDLQSVFSGTTIDMNTILNTQPWLAQLAGLEEVTINSLEKLKAIYGAELGAMKNIELANLKTTKNLYLGKYEEAEKALKQYTAGFEKGRTNISVYNKEVERLTNNLNVQRQNYYDSAKAVNVYERDMNKAYDELMKTSDAANGLTGDLGGLADGLGKAGGAASKSADELKQFGESLRSTLEGQMDVFSEFKKAEGHTKEELFKNIESQINGMAAWAVNMDKLSEKGIDQGLYQKLAEMGPQGAGYMEAFLSMTQEELAKYNNLWATSLVLPDTVSTMLTGSLQKAGENSMLGLYNGVKGGHQQVVDEFTNVATESVETVENEWDTHSPSVVFHEKGKDAMEGLRLGLMHGQGNVFARITFICQHIVALTTTGLQPGKFSTISQQAMEGLRSGIDSGAEQATTAASNAATNIIQGLKNGIEAGTNEVVAAATKMIQSVVNAVNKKTESHSPSKLFERMGKYLDEGMAIGIRKGTNMVVDSIENMADASIDAMKFTIANIAAQVNDSFEDPVITPVLDLSNVRAGARDLNNIFNANQAAVRAGSFTSNQNGQEIGSGAVIFNQNNYSPKALSRIEIYRDTRNLFAQAKGALS